MGKSLNEIAQQLKDNGKNVQLIYAFNGTGKTRLSREFKLLIAPQGKEDTEFEELEAVKFLYYNAFTEDLFYWDNDLQNDTEPKLKIYPNSFTKWIFEEQGQDGNIIKNFQNYSDKKLNPRFNEEYSIKDKDGKDITIGAFTEITFSYERGNEERSNNIKISKGEESNFVWCVFYTLLEQVIDVLNVVEPSNRGTNQFDQLEYVFIDDPVSSLDDNHLIELAVDLAQLIKSNIPNLKFIITTHNPLFYNVLCNEFNNSNRETGYNNNKHFKKHRLEKKEEGIYELISQPNDSPFSYHLFLINEIDKAIASEQIYKYHFNFLRNILEKMSTFLGYSDWGDLLLPVKGSHAAYEKRILNLSSHSKHSGEEIVELTNDDKNVLRHLISEIKEIYRFKKLIKGGNE
ncbi:MULTISPECIES: AAA family ATPase [unclassified Paenibacillus]|uniref:AAA family ATPase n=1 Tax=unclassified Paenibacillus TaxID=185978 RepID=UPI0004910062|nr:MULTISPECIES: AAA family ATPase [unclassified Paenibacillus]SFR25570.1 AAA domain-containing protein [Paenibacillus sp. cl130]